MQGTDFSEFTLRASDMIAIGAAVVSLAGAMIAAFMANGASKRLAFARSREERRHFCLHLQQQFDSPEFFQCRFKAWQKLNNGDFNPPIRLGELLHGEHWTPEVSTTIHFFESLNRYCDEDLIDEELATKLFGRSYEMWWRGLIGQIIVDEAGEPYRDWLHGIQALHGRIVGADRSIAPILMANGYTVSSTRKNPSRHRAPDRTSSTGTGD